MMKHISLLLIGVILTQNVVAKTNRNAPQGHKGILNPYTPGPFDMTLENDDEKTLGKGNPVMKQIPAADGSAGGSAICVQDIEAPKSAVWNQILDLDHYTDKVKQLKECRNYYVKANPDGSTTMKTKQVIGVLPGYKYENYYDHLYRPETDSVTWSLDYDKTSDFDDAAGHWHVEVKFLAFNLAHYVILSYQFPFIPSLQKDHPKKPGCSRVFYACDLKFKRSLPKPIMNILQSTALKQATAWVKKESESAPDNTIPAEFVPEFAVQ
jgi:hypothetical protein